VRSSAAIASTLVVVWYATWRSSVRGLRTRPWFGHVRRPWYWSTYAPTSASLVARFEPSVGRDRSDVKPDALSVLMSSGRAEPGCAPGAAAAAMLSLEIPPVANTYECGAARVDPASIRARWTWAPSPAAVGCPTGRPVSACGTAASCGSSVCFCTTMRIRDTTSWRAHSFDANGPISTLAPSASWPNGRGPAVPPHVVIIESFADLNV
jgi:hypothetical protein